MIQFKSRTFFDKRNKTKNYHISKYWNKWKFK